MTMSVAVDVPAQDFGYGVKTPAMQVANIDRITQRQNAMIFSGILSVVGAILLGFGAMAPKVSPPVLQADTPLPTLGRRVPAIPTHVSICPKCRHMGDGNATVCARCESQLKK
ncbi:hypothetical protein CR105_16125 [Massilia eurypsychrophila]|uniref:Uncharacterized protein n=2 Tax=Massilia eurypsychrophila TaxID=1485217 RepID=A0A2G8TCU5_9BURK|nr:hypothetical protein CR105_16125 [Massilia eurypsychrophila]